MTGDVDGEPPDADRPAEDRPGEEPALPSGAESPAPEDDLEGFRTPLSRLVDHARAWMAVLVAAALVLPLGAWLVDEIRFRLSSGAVVETLEGELAGEDVAQAVLLVRTAGCRPRSGGSGTAFVVDAGEGPMLVTNRHVVADARRVGVRALEGSTGVRVTGYRVSGRADVAVLEVADPAELPPALVLRDTPLSEGGEVRLVGFPSAQPFTTAGTVRDADRGRMLLDLRVDPGASGSPVVDREGRVAGQVFARTDEGLGVATPAGRLLAALEDLRPVAAC